MSIRTRKGQLTYGTAYHFSRSQAATYGQRSFFKNHGIQTPTRLHSWLIRLFPKSRLTSVDYTIACLFLAACFVSFVHGDIEYLGQNSLNFLFGNPLDFYDNAKKYTPLFGAAYPPPLYAIFALWLYPWKLLGIITGPQALPPYLVYWLKIATTLTYIGSAYTFHLIAKVYFPDDGRAKYATAAWFTAPIALFSQFIFSQTDIFYVEFTLLGYLMFLRRHLLLASTYFGLAITFKDFPVISFLPILFLLEKRPTRILTCGLIFLTPTLLFRAIYAHSPALNTEHIHRYFIERIYPASIVTSDEALWRIYLLPLAYVILCGVAYFRNSPPERRINECAYVWLVSTVLLFMTILWHPQWMIMPIPAIVLTSMLSNRIKAFMTLDLVGMAFFIAAASLLFQSNVDASMFRGDLLKIEFHNSYLMADFFNWFGDHSANLFLTCFVGYLLLQVLLKYCVYAGDNLKGTEELDYGNIRLRLYVGLSFFLMPAVFVIWKDLAGQEVVVRNEDYEQNYPLSLKGAVEQTFIAEGSAIRSISIAVNTYGRNADDDLVVELADANGKRLSRVDAYTLPTREISWHRFMFGNLIPVQKGAQYSFRVISTKGSPGDAFSIGVSTEDVYRGGHAIIDGHAATTDLAFRIEFSR